MTIDEQIAALEEAISTGARKVVTQSNGVRTEVEYHSLSDMEKSLARLRARQSKSSPVILAGF